MIFEAEFLPYIVKKCKEQASSDPAGTLAVERDSELEKTERDYAGQQRQQRQKDSPRFLLHV